MKSFTLLAGIIAMAVTGAFGQSSLHYNFNDVLTENTGTGPELTPLGITGEFVLDTLNEINGKTKTVYRFEQNCGLQFDNAAAGTFMGDTYSIEMYFVFDDLASWKRVVDWKNRKTDDGAYIYYGQLNFYNYITSGDAPVVPGEYTYYVITRDGATKNLVIYTDAKSEISFTDADDEGVIDQDQVLHFFYDDLVVPNEASSGAVALLNLYNYVLDTNTIKQRFADLTGPIFGVESHGNALSSLRAYPNPSGGTLWLDLNSLRGSSEVRISVLNLEGSALMTRVVSPGTVRMDVGSLPNGVYLVRAETDSRVATGKLVLTH